MWNCVVCSEQVDDDFEVCWNCKTSKNGTPPDDLVPNDLPKELENLRERMSNASDDDLGRIVNVDFKQYRDDAVLLARAELARRNLPMLPLVNIVGEEQLYECSGCGVRLLLDDDVCPNCGDDISEVDESAEDEPSVKTIADEQSKQPIKLEKPIEASKGLVGVGIVILIIGVAVIIISPNLVFSGSSSSDLFHPGDGLSVSIWTTDLSGVTMFFGVALLIVGGIISAVGYSQSTSTPPTPLPTPTSQPAVTQSVPPKKVELGNTPDEVQSAIGQPDKIVDLGVRVIHVYKDMKIIYDDGKVSDVQL